MRPLIFSFSSEQPPLSYSNEIRAARFLRSAAQAADAAYAAAPFDSGVQDERLRLLADRDAQATRMCDADLRLRREPTDGEADSEGAEESEGEAAQRRVQSGCLTLNQRNMLLVRLGERALLRMLVAVGDAADLFAADPPADRGNALGWLDRHAAPDQRGQAAFVFVDKILLPLFLREQGWTADLAPPSAPAPDSAAAAAGTASPSCPNPDAAPVAPA